MKTKPLINKYKLKTIESHVPAASDLEKMDKQFKNDYPKKRISIKGSLLFYFRVKNAIKLLPEPFLQSFELIFPARHIVVSERLSLDIDLGILYLKNTLRTGNIAEIFLSIITNSSISGQNAGIYEKQEKPKNIAKNIFRKIFRVSIEKRIYKSIVNIVSSAPRGKVATEDQHFLMIIMQLKMYIRSIMASIEKQSDIAFIEKDLKYFQKILTQNKKKYLASFASAETAGMKKIVSDLESMLLEKRLLLQ